MSKGARIGVGAANLLVAVLVGWGVFRGLPTRWWPVDLVGTVVSGLLAASGFALLGNRAAAPRITRLAAGVALAVGLLVFAALVFTASWLAGVYGPVGKGGAILFLLVAALVLPYLIALPIGELLWLGASVRRRSSS